MRKRRSFISGERFDSSRDDSFSKSSCISRVFLSRNSVAVIAAASRHESSTGNAIWRLKWRNLNLKIQQINRRSLKGRDLLRRLRNAVQVRAPGRTPRTKPQAIAHGLVDLGAIRAARPAAAPSPPHG